MRLAVIFVLALSIHILHAQDKSAPQEKSFVEKLRPKLMDILGEEWTVKLIGAEKAKPADELPMPAIPKIENDARSVAVYEKKADKIILKPDVEEKFRYAYINELYEAVRQTKPNDDELGKFMNVLNQGGTREGIYRSIVLDSVYGGMENLDKPVRSVSADFAVYFYDKYIGKKIVKKSFEGMSIYTLKRLLPEKALEIADAFGDNREGLENWYAIMSADLAKKFPLVWSNKLRKNQDSAAHKAWASKVPVEHIKSELIIKLHSALNSMI